MLRKHFHIGKSQTKSRISFKLPESGLTRFLAYWDEYVANDTCRLSEFGFIDSDHR